MQFDSNDIQNIAGLRLALHNVGEEIKTIAALATQLASDDVEFALIIQMHNKTICAKNKSRFRVRKLSEDLPFLMVPYASNHDKCRTEYAFVMDEPRALQAINLILVQKKLQFEEIKKELEKILQLNQTPIQLLHAEQVK